MPEATGSARSHRLRANARCAFALLLAGGAVLGVTWYPLAPLWLGFGLAVYAALLWRWPRAWLVLVPALLPTFDLAAWSGRFFFDEADFLVLATAAVLYARLPLLSRAVLPNRIAPAIALLLAAAHLAALLRGLVPLAPIGLNAFNTYFSPYNALRVARGLGWALLLLPALSHALAADRRGALRLFGLGLAGGLAVVVLVALRERMAFTGLFDVEIPFRITATFASMHIGGGSIAAFLALTLPFLALPFVLPTTWLERVAAVGLLIAAGYVLLVTFNRAAYLGVSAAFLVLLAALPLALHRSSATRGQSGGKAPPRFGWLMPVASLLAVAAVVAGISAAALPGSFAAARFEQVEEDLARRLWQWQAGLALGERTALAAAVGNGLGSYPRMFLEREGSGPRPATFALVRESGRTFLHLGAGENLYFGQRVAARPGTSYRLALSLRAGVPAQLVVLICEKTLLYSFRCEAVSFLSQLPGRWERREIDIRLDEIGRPAGILGWVTGRPVELALFNPEVAGGIDVDDLSLVALDGSEAGRELLVNGGFDSGNDHWFFTVDNLSIWRIENMALMTLFEQGWCGLAALLLAVGAALVVLARLILAGPPAEAGCAAVLLAGIVGFLVVGAAHSLVDAPRTMALLYLVLFAALCLAKPAARPA